MFQLIKKQWFDGPLLIAPEEGWGLFEPSLALEIKIVKKA